MSLRFGASAGRQRLSIGDWQIVEHTGCLIFFELFQISFGFFWILSNSVELFRILSNSLNITIGVAG